MHNKHKKYKTSLVKEFAFIAIIFVILLALTLPMTVAYFTDEKTEQNAVPLNFGSVEITGADTLSLALDGVEYDGTAKLWPGSELEMSVTLERSANADNMYVLAGCGISICYLTEEFKASSAFTSATTGAAKASAILADIENTSKGEAGALGCINFSALFMDATSGENWITYNGMTAENGSVLNKDDGNGCGNMRLLSAPGSGIANSVQSLTMTGDILINTSMPSKFTYNGEEYSIMGTNGDFYILLDLYVEVFQYEGVSVDYAHQELSAMLGKRSGESGAASFWDGSVSSNLVEATDGDGDYYAVRSGADFAKLMEDETLSNINSIKKFKLTTSINMGNTTWTPSSEEFTGILDGNGYSLTGLNINIENERLTGLFETIDTTGVVKNLTIKRPKIDVNFSTDLVNDTISVGVIAANNYGVIQNCTIMGDSEIDYNTTVVANDDQPNTKDTSLVGGIVGLNYGWVDQCSNSGSIESKTIGGAYVGGIAGRNTHINGDTSTGYITNCVNNAKVKAMSKEYTMAGGIVGQNYLSGVVLNCYNSGDVYTEIIGWELQDGSSSHPVYGSCYSGGIAGQNQGSTTYAYAIIASCVNTGSVQATQYKGAKSYNDNGSVKEYWTRGTSIDSNTRSGGIVGNATVRKDSNGASYSTSVEYGCFFLSNSSKNTNMSYTADMFRGSGTPLNMIDCGKFTSLSSMTDSSSYTLVYNSYNVGMIESGTTQVEGSLSDILYSNNCNIVSILEERVDAPFSQYFYESTVSEVYNKRSSYCNLGVVPASHKFTADIADAGRDIPMLNWNYVSPDKITLS